MEIRFKRYDGNKPFLLPAYHSDGASGLDLCSADEDTALLPGETKLIGTNLIPELPDGFEAQVRPRSGLALKHGITVLNSPGTVDSDYRGEIKVLLINHGKSEFVIKTGDRIAQMVISKYEKIIPAASDELSATSRGEGGYGSTGISVPHEL